MHDATKKRWAWGRIHGAIAVPKGLLAAALVLAGWAAACEGCKATKPVKTQDITPATPTARLVLLSDLGAALEPCGCVADQRGGLARLGAFTEGNPFPVAVAAAGPTFFDCVDLDTSRAAQDTEKAQAVAGVLARTPFFFAPSRSDFAGGVERLRELVNTSRGKAVSGALTVAGQAFGAPGVVDMGPTKVAFLGYSGRSRDASVADVAGVQFGAEGAADGAALAKNVETLRAAGARFVVLLASGSRGEAQRIVDRAPGIDLLLVGTDAVRGEVIRDDVPLGRIEHTVVLQPASRLQSVVVVELVDRGGVFREGGLAEEGSRFSVRTEPMGAARAKSQGIGAILSAYDERLDGQNRVRYAGRVPVSVAAGEAHYLGVDVCTGCHTEPASVWRGTRHADAYATLTTRHKAFDLDCVGCHVTGYDKPGGSTVTHAKNLENVQCESCHGPGSKHVEGGGLKSAIVRKPDVAVCTGCHHEPHVDKSWRVEDAWPKILGHGHGRP